MSITYYIDESGYSGDLIKSGQRLDFGGQPFFSLACVGVSDRARLRRSFERLKSRYGMPATEVKSSKSKGKPEFVRDVIRYVCDEQLPFFIEVIDKKYFLCIHVIQCHVLTSWHLDDLSKIVRNRFADYLYDNAPQSVLEKFIAACAVSSEHALVESFESLLSWTRDAGKNSEVARDIHAHTMETREEYRRLKLVRHDAAARFLPAPDYGKRRRSIWMLPSLSSFCNIYARINLFQRGELSAVRMVHDQQKELHRVIGTTKETLECLFRGQSSPYTPHADYRFNQSAVLSFADSVESVGLQVADIFAGFVLRYFSQRVGLTAPNEEMRTLFVRLVDSSDAARGVGINFVVPARLAPVL